jgi:death on curing protein
LGGKQPLWIVADEVEAIARELLRGTPEPFRVLDRGALESAVARPLNAWAYDGETDLIILAVRLLEGIGQSHCFQQGNKRTAFFAAIEFIEANGGEFDDRDTEILATVIEGVILKTISRYVLVEALRKKVKF